MSEENRKTLEVYERTASTYLANTKKHDELDPEKAYQKSMNLKVFLGKTFSPLREHAKIFEIGSADGVTAKHLERIGFDVTASDVAEDFIKTIAETGVKVIKFNALTDEFPDKYDGILAWRVLVHFTKEDFEKLLGKVYDALEPYGRFAFNMMNREVREVDNEWVDFPGEYYMGEDRFYCYYREEDVRAIIAKTKFRIIDFHKEGGKHFDKWLVFVLEK